MGHACFRGVFSPLEERAFMRITTVACALVCAFLSAAAAAAPKPITLAVGPLPPGRANFHDSVSITRGWLYAALFDALTFIDRDGQLQPWLAESWTQEGPNTWRITLKGDVRFANGQPLTAKNVVTTIDYLRSPAARGEAAGGFVETIAAVTAAGPREVRITTRSPDPTLMRKLSLVRVAILPDGQPLTREALMAGAIGTGPYKIETWSPAKAVLTAVPGAWRRAPTPQLIAVALPDAAARRMALTSGEADVTFSAFDWSEFDDPGGRSFVLAEDKIPSVVALGYNTEKPNSPFKDVRVRKALAHAVNAQAIIDGLFAGHGALASQPARREFLGFNAGLKPVPYDVAEAKRLLAEAGHARGLAFTMVISAGGTVWDQVFQMVATDLAKVNVRMTIRAVPEQTMAEMLYSVGFKDDAFAATYFATTFDALDATRQHGCGWQVVWYCDRVSETLRDEALAAETLEARRNATQRLMARAQENAQALFLYESVSTVSYAKRLKNFRSDFGFIRYELIEAE
jgi:peptide/nickel transport system substrate-binding protein